MLVELAKLKNNPFRDFTIDPIEPEAVEELRKSIHDDGWWGGVVVRRNADGELEIACGHHRRDAAILAGLKKVDIEVKTDLPDWKMVRIYIRENALQRGNSSSAIAGSVAAALRMVAKAILTGVEPADSVLQIWSTVQSLCTLQGLITSDKGIGRDPVCAFMRDDKGKMPRGISDAVVWQQLANLRESGHYARIIHEVREEIDAELRERLIQEEIEADRKRQIAEAKAAKEAAAIERQRLAEEKAARDAEEKRQRDLEAAQRRAEAAIAAQVKAAERAKTAQEAAERKAAETEAKRAAAEAKTEQQRLEREQRKAENERRRQKELAEAQEKARKKTEADLAKRRQKEMDEAAAAFHGLQKVQANSAAADAVASKREVTFDQDGVQRHLKNEYQVRTFREVVTGEGVRPYLPLEAQEAWAKELVRRAKDRKIELTGAYIRDETMAEYLYARNGEHQLSKREEEVRQHKDIIRKWNARMEKFSLHLRGMLSVGIEMKEMLAKHPGMTFPVSQRFRNDLDTAKNVIDVLSKRV